MNLKYLQLVNNFYVLLYNVIVRFMHSNDVITAVLMACYMMLIINMEEIELHLMTIILTITGTACWLNDKKTEALLSVIWLFGMYLPNII